MQSREEILAALKPLGLNQAAFIDPNTIVFSPEVRALCEMNSCGIWDQLAMPARRR